MSPTTKYVVKCVGFGVYAFLSSLASVKVASGNAIGIDQLETAVILGGLGGLGYAGIGAATTLEAPGKK